MSDRQSIPSILLAGLLVLLPSAYAAAVAPADGSKQRFDIYQDSKKIGQLEFDFSSAGSDLVVVRRQSISVSKLLIKATLDESSTERWSGDRLVHLEAQAQLKSTIKDDSATLELSLGADGQLTGKTGKGPLSVPAGTSLFTLWRAASLHDGSYFNYVDGKLVQVTLGKEPARDQAPEHTPADCTGMDATVADAEGHTSHALVWHKGDGSICSVRIKGPGGEFDYLLAAG
ncbi:MAG TPA: DUF6134 family protein [Nevskiaceae bacterium]|nr:DUF6134 family protein [Nevskiaceae bacterium]